MLRGLSHSILVRFSLMVLVGLAGPGPLCASEEDPGLRDRFLEGVAQAAEKLEHLSYRAKFQYIGRNEGKDAGTETDTRNSEVAIRGSCILKTRVKPGTVESRGRNDDYAFALSKQSDGERISLEFVEQLGVDPKLDARIAAMEEEPRRMALGGFYLWNDPLFHLVESGSLSIKRVNGVTSEGKDLVRVEFDCLVDDSTGRPKYEVTEGFLVCDPAREWVLTEYGGTYYRFVNKTTSLLHAVLEYGDVIDGIPIATKTTRTMDLQDSDFRLESVLTAEIISRDVPEEEFYLSHYGLPEPNFNRPWFGAWAWYLIAGIGCLVISATILKRRRAAG